jgi:hypothetical protein
MTNTYFFGLVEKVLRVLIGTMVPGNTGDIGVCKDRTVRSNNQTF